MDLIFHPAVAAILTGDLDGLRAILRADPTLVHQHSSCSHPTLLQLVACEAKHLPDAVGAAAVLVEAGAAMAEPLVAAASVDARDVLLFLLAQGIGVDDTGDWRPLDEALYWRHLELADLLVARGARIRTLRVAAGLGRVEEVERFFVQGRLVDHAGPIGSPFDHAGPVAPRNQPQDILDNAFVMAVHNGKQEVAAILLARGANICAKPPGFHWRGTALHAAVWSRNLPMLDWLLAHGADPSIQDDSYHADAVGWADHNGFPEIATLLRRHRGDAEAT